MRKQPLILILLAALAPWLPARATGSPRIEETLTAGWRFTRGDPPEAQAPAFDDSAWAKVTLPHTWNIQDAEAGNKRRFYRGPGWYRLRLTPGSTWKGREVFLRFGAACATAKVFVNGKAAGDHRGGYSAFCVDITPRLNRDRENIVAVQVDNAKFDGPPIGGDFTKFGGLYRPVTLLALEPVSLDPTDIVHLHQSGVSSQSARLGITVPLRKGTGTERQASIHCRLLDGQGREVQTLTGTATLAPETSTQWTGSMTVTQPHLWQGRDDPYLYRLAIEIRNEERLLDATSTLVGFRSFHVDPEKGFFLNGRPYPLHGVNRHQDFAGKGSATGPREMRHDIELMQELGCTAVRLVHYQQAPEFYTLCDEAGLVVWAEPALVNDINPFSPAFTANARQQLTELIRQNSNHPSICVWGLWNEWTLVKKWRGQPGAEEAAERFLGEIAHLAKNLDPTRLTAAASCAPRHLATAKLPDLLGWNSYPGWYSGQPADLGWILDELRQECPASTIGLSEHGAGAGLKFHAADPPCGSPDKDRHTEERQALVLEGHFAEIDRRPWLWCDFVWQLADCASIMRQEGDHPGFNDKGLVSYDRAVKKDAFYLCKARWSQEPFVYINSRRFTPRPPGQHVVKVYSNCAQVELWINGKSQGTRVSSSHVFHWSGITIRPGKNSARAMGTLNGKTYEDQCEWDGRKLAAPLATHTAASCNPVQPQLAP